MNLPPAVPHSSAVEFLQKLFLEVTGDVPDEAEASLYLHRLLIEGESREAIAQQVRESASVADPTAKEFIRRAYRELAGRDASEQEIGAAAAEIQRSGREARVALIRRLAELPAGAGSQASESSGLRQYVAFLWNLPTLWRRCQELQRQHVETHRQMRAIQMELDEVVRRGGPGEP